jgi:hypothetical protein
MIRFIDKRSVGETPTGATETVALPGTQKLSVNRIGTEISDLDACFRSIVWYIPALRCLIYMRGGGEINYSFFYGISK